MQKNQSETSILPVYHFWNEPVMRMAQVRDNLLFTLLSELSYNKFILNWFAIKLERQIQQGSKIQVKKQECSSTYFWTKEESLKNRLKITKKIKKRRNNLDTLIKNDTKNIPKNYGKAILSYILKSQRTRKLTSSLGINLSEFLTQIKKMKSRINSIEGLRSMWGSKKNDTKQNKCIRILSYQFMRKHCLQYIFHSKVKNFGTHIKYRQKLVEGLQNPEQFSHIKDY